jgi:hypothetical protein
MYVYRLVGWFLKGSMRPATSNLDVRGKLTFYDNFLSSLENWYLGRKRFFWGFRALEIVAWIYRGLGYGGERVGKSCWIG